jgi:hypothetical protein
MATTKIFLDGQLSLTINLGALANGSAKVSWFPYPPSSSFVNEYMDVLVMGSIRTALFGVSSTGRLHLYFYGSIDDWDGSETSTFSDGPLTPNDTHILNDNAKHVATITANSNNMLAAFGPYSVASAFGGCMPVRWGVIVKNDTGASLPSDWTHKIIFRGFKVQTV